MITGTKMLRAWEGWEGLTVDGRFPLVKYLGSGEVSAVFLTERVDHPLTQAAIKIVSADEAAAKFRLARWELASRLSHPHLIRLFEMGRSRLDQISFVYLVMEYAEEDLSKVDRPLTPGEAFEMLGPTLDTLGYLHGQRLAHGRLKPSNIMAVNDRLRISSEAVRPFGEGGDLERSPRYSPPEIASSGASAKGDVWSLGMTLVEALTKSLPSRGITAEELILPKTLPGPFDELARNCLRWNPQDRWTVADLAEWLQRHGDPSFQPRESVSPAKSGRKRYAIPLAAVGLAVAAAVSVPYLTKRQPEAAIVPASVPNQPTPRVEETRTAETPSESTVPPSESRQPKAAAKAATKLVSPNGVQQDVVQQVLPEVPVKARNTIHGKVTVRVRVRVDPSGDVADVKNESTGASRYFGNLALQAARQWKFAPARANDSAGSREWMLRFEFANNSNRPVSVQAAPSP